MLLGYRCWRASARRRLCLRLDDQHEMVPGSQGLVTGIAMAGSEAAPSCSRRSRVPALNGVTCSRSSSRSVWLRRGDPHRRDGAAFRRRRRQPSTDAPPLKRCARPFFLSLVLGMFCGTFAGIWSSEPRPMPWPSASRRCRPRPRSASLRSATRPAGSRGVDIDRTSEWRFPSSSPRSPCPWPFWLGRARRSPSSRCRLPSASLWCVLRHLRCQWPRYGLSAVAGIYPWSSWRTDAGIIGPPSGMLYDRRSATVRHRADRGCRWHRDRCSIWLLRKAKAAQVASYAGCHDRCRRLTDDAGAHVQGYPPFAHSQPEEGASGLLTPLAQVGSSGFQRPPLLRQHDA